MENNVIRKNTKYAVKSPKFVSVNKLIIAFILVTLTVSVSASGINLDFCPKGFLATPDGDIKFDRRPHTSDYMLKKTDGFTVKFSGPIFPGYKIAKFKEQVVNSQKMSIKSFQFCKEFDAKVKKVFALKNGGVLANISYDTQKTITKPVKYRIFLPLETFAGKAISVDGNQLVLPKNKSKNYMLKRGKTFSEVRLPLSGELELGIKFIKGMKNYAIADCRHHGKTEKHFHLYFDMDGTDLQYYLHLLKKGQEFPDATSKNSAQACTAVRINLLGNGSGFEVGPCNMNPMAAYSWNEAWTDPAIQPEFDETNAKQGKYSLKLTAEDIKDKSGRFNMNAVQFRRVKLDASKTYTLSAWMKTDAEKMRACLECKEGIWLGTSGKTVDVSKDWKKYSYTFTPKKYKVLNYCKTWIGLHPNMKKGRLWIDDVQLQEGEQTEELYKPIEFGAQIKQKYKLFTTDELKNGVITLFFRNNTAEAIDCKINYVIKNYWDKVVAKGDVNTSIAANDNKTEDVKIPELPIGYYRVYFENNDQILKDEAIFGVYQPMAFSGRLPFDWPLGCDNSEGNPIVRKLGFGWTRCWNFGFKRICPEKGKFNFKETDTIVERCRKANLNIMPVLGTKLATAKYNKGVNPNIPDWAIEKRVKSTKKNSWAVDVCFPTIESWKYYVKTVVTRYKEYIKAWEVMNEPNCWVTPEEYAPYLKATYEAAKEADPDCIIVGVCSTSDWGGEPAPWTTKVLKLVKCQSLDVLSIHMYTNSSPELYKGSGSDNMLAYLKGVMKKYGRDIPIWHTEKSLNTTKMGYSADKLNTPPVYLLEAGFRVPDFRAKAQYLIRETLIDSSVGKGPYFWFGSLCNDIYMAPRRRVYGLHHTEYDGSPCPELIAANGLARMLEGRSTPKELMKLDAATYCALYEGKKGAMVALWNSEGPAKIKLMSGIDNFSVNNFFGVPITNVQNGIINIGKEPVYLLFDGKNAGEVKNIIQNSEATGPKFSLSGDIEYENDQFALTVYAYNKTVKDRNADVKLSSIPAGWNVGEKSTKKQCQPLKYNRISFPVTNLQPSNIKQFFEADVANEKAVFSLPPIKSAKWLKAVLAKSTAATAYQASITVDGDLSEWDDAGLCGAATGDKVKWGRKFWKDPADLSCEMRYRWNKDYLFVGVIVYDNVVERSESANKAWGSDCIELFLGLDPASKERAAKSDKINKTSKTDFQLLFAPGDSKGIYKNATGWCCQLKSDIGIKIASKIIKNGYRIEAAIPWKSLRKDFQPTKGTTLLMTYQVKDTDMKGQASQKCIFWTGNEANWMSPKNWGTLVLK